MEHRQAKAASGVMGDLFAGPPSSSGRRHHCIIQPPYLALMEDQMYFEISRPVLTAFRRESPDHFALIRARVIIAPTFGLSRT